MSDLRQLRAAAGLARIRLAAAAQVSAYRLWQAENSMITLRPEETEAVNKVLAPFLAQTARTVLEYQRQAVNR